MTTARVLLSAVSTVTCPGPSHSTLATTVPFRSNSYLIVTPSLPLALPLDSSPIRRWAVIRTRGRKNPSRGEGRLARGSVGLSPARAYAISTRLLRPVTALVDMVWSV